MKICGTDGATTADFDPKLVTDCWPMRGLMSLRDSGSFSVDKRSPEIRNAVTTMSIPALERFVGGWGVDTPMSICTAVTQRLYEVGLFENYVSTDQRISALELLETVKLIVETSWRDTPNAIATYRSANAETEDRAKRLGVGSLAWRRPDGLRAV